MARWEPPIYAEWTSEKLEDEIEKLRKKRDETARKFHELTLQLAGQDSQIKSMQFYVICKAGLRDVLRGYPGEGI